MLGLLLLAVAALRAYRRTGSAFDFEVDAPTQTKVAMALSIGVGAAVTGGAIATFGFNLGSSVLVIVSAVVGIVSAVFGASAYEAIGPAFGPAAKHNTTAPLTTDGPYRLFRHPQFTGLFGFVVGLTIGVPVIAPFTIGVFVFLQIQARLEEAVMIGVRGTAYSKYMARTRHRFFPGDLVLP